jgi:hypothetical protein
MPVSSQLLSQPVVKVARLRERGILGQIKAENRSNIRDLARFSNADLAAKAPSERGAGFAASQTGADDMDEGWVGHPWSTAGQPTP